MNWIDWLTALGALLGTIAFFQNAFTGIASANKAKWAALGPEVITEDMLAYALNDIRHGTVNERTQKALLQLNNKLQSKGDALKFKSLGGDPYAKHLNILLEVSDSMRTRLFKPEWKKHPYPDGVGAVFALDDAGFQERYGTQGMAAVKEKVRKDLEQDLKRALHALTTVRVLANREDIEYLLPWKWRVG
jgi:hypothetical protein